MMRRMAGDNSYNPINEERLRKAFAKAKLFTEPVFISIGLPEDEIVDDFDGLLITYVCRKSV